MQAQVDLASFSTKGFDRGASAFKGALWLVVSLVLFRMCPLCLSSLKCAVLRLFGARVGPGVIIKPGSEDYLSLETNPWRQRVARGTMLAAESGANRNQRQRLYFTARLPLHGQS